MALQSVEAEIMTFFMSHGYTRAQAAGIAGNIKQESDYNPNAPGGGLIQGQGGRTSSGTVGQQLSGVLRELEGPFAGVNAQLKRATSPEEAARIFSSGFEKPGIPALSNREKYAREAFGSKVSAAGVQLFPTLGDLKEAGKFLTDVSPFEHLGEKVGNFGSNPLAPFETIGNAFKKINETLEFLTSSAGWVRILKVLGGAVIVIIGLNELTKAPGEISPVRNVANIPAKTAKKAIAKVA